MDLKRVVVARAVAWAVLGSLVGGFAMDTVWGYGDDDTGRRLAESETRIADQAVQVERLSARQRLQEVVSRGRK